MGAQHVNWWDTRQGSTTWTSITFQGREVLPLASSTTLAPLDHFQRELAAQLQLQILSVRPLRESFLTDKLFQPRDISLEHQFRTKAHNIRRCLFILQDTHLALDLNSRNEPSILSCSSIMPPLLKAKQSLTKDRFAAYFAPYKSQAYHDPAASRGTASHGSVILLATQVLMPQEQSSMWMTS